MGTLILLFITGYVISHFLKKHNGSSRKAMKGKIQKGIASKTSTSAIYIYNILAERRNAKRSTSNAISGSNYSNRFQNILDEEADDEMGERDYNSHDSEARINRAMFVEGVGEVIATPVRYLPLSPWGGTQTPEDYK